MSDTVTACPECDSPTIIHNETVTPPWLCRECRSRFYEPNERQTRIGAPCITPEAAEGYEWKWDDG